MEKPRLGEGEDRQGPPSAQPSQRENSAVQRLLLWPKELSLVTPVNTTLDKLSPQKSTTAAAAGEAEAGEGETGPKTKFPPSPGMIKASFVDMTISRGNRPLFRCFTMRPLAGREQDTKKPVLRGKVIGYRRLDTDVGEEQYLVHWDGGIIEWRDAKALEATFRKGVDAFQQARKERKERGRRAEHKDEENKIKIERLASLHLQLLNVIKDSLRQGRSIALESMSLRRAVADFVELFNWYDADVLLQIMDYGQMMASTPVNDEKGRQLQAFFMQRCQNKANHDSLDIEQLSNILNLQRKDGKTRLEQQKEDNSPRPCQSWELRRLELQIKDLKSRLADAQVSCEKLEHSCHQLEEEARRQGITRMAPGGM